MVVFVLMGTADVSQAPKFGHLLRIWTFLRKTSESGPNFGAISESASDGPDCWSVPKFLPFSDVALFTLYIKTLFTY